MASRAKETLIKIIPGNGETDYALARVISEGPGARLDIDLSFQNIKDELSDFLFDYGPPDSVYLLVLKCSHRDSTADGCCHDGFRRHRPP